MKIKLFLLRCLRQIGKRIYRKKHTEYSTVQYKGQEASDLIYEYLNRDKPCMVARFGSGELGCVVNYLRLAEKNSTNYLRYIKGENIRFEWAKNIRDGMERAAGFFPASDENLEKFSLLMLECIPNVDILGSYWPDEIYVKDRIANAKIVDLPDIEPYYHNNPWSRVLKGKKVLVIHPFVETIKSQYLKRDKLFRNNDILPEFKLETIKAVQSIAYNDCGYKNWFDALEAMKFQITQKEYDIAIIGCGAYGFPLASFIKEQGKKAVHLGGATQVLFGIKGGRWDELEFISKLYNEYWVRPSKEETPIRHKKVENGCYW